MNAELVQFNTRILAPIDVNQFFAQYWEKQPLHISRAKLEAFADVLSETAVLDKLMHSQCYFPGVQLTQSNRQIRPDTYTSDQQQIVPKQVVALHSAGATLVWSQAHEWFDELASLCREIQTALRLPCLANVYLSPASQQGFNAHYDAHDVFIVQVSGSKTFRFYQDGVTLPFSYEKFDSSVHQAGKKTEEIELTAGDTLYIPRGMMHDAVAHGNTASLHITFGVYTATYKDLKQKIVQLQADTDVSLRNSVGALLSGSAADLLKPISNSQSLDADYQNKALALLQDQLALDAIPVEVNVTEAAVDQLQLSPDDQLLINFKNIMSVSRIGESVTLRLYGKVLEYNGQLAEAIEWLVLRKQAAFTLNSLPGLDNDSRIALSKQLLIEGALDLLD